MVSSSREWNVASRFFPNLTAASVYLFPEKVELVVMDLQHDYEHEHEKATSELGVGR
jgi:hypothetical protein